MMQRFVEQLDEAHKHPQQKRRLESTLENSNAGTVGSEPVVKKAKAPDKNDRQEERKKLLIAYNYEGLKSNLATGLKNGEAILSLATTNNLEKFDISDLDNVYNLLHSTLQTLQTAWTTIETIDSSFAKFLKNKLQNELIKANEILTKLTDLKIYLFHINKLQNEINELDQARKNLVNILGHCDKETWTANKNSISATDIEKIKELKMALNRVNELKQSVREIHSHMNKLTPFYKNNKQLPITLNKALNIESEVIVQRAVLLNKVSNLYKQVILLQNLESSKKNCHSTLYQNYLAGHIESTRQDLIDDKNEIIKSFSSPSTATSSSSSTLFAKKLVEVQSKTPITTWKRGQDTSIQEYFLDAFLQNGLIRTALNKLKRREFNISFLEYIQDGEYKILFALSGSNEALFDKNKKYSDGKGVNALIEKFVQQWNSKNPGIHFQYVVSYNGNNLNMDVNDWLCSEPKLAIEYSKITKANISLSHCFIGQNNWGINPVDFSNVEQDACTRHCQPNQDKMLSFVPNSPLRLTS